MDTLAPAPHKRVRFGLSFMQPTVPSNVTVHAIRAVRYDYEIFAFEKSISGCCCAKLNTQNDIISMQSFCTCMHPVL